MLTKTNRVHPCPIDSIRRFSYPLQRHYSIHAFVFLSLSPSDFRLVGSVLTQTDRVHLCPIDSIRRLFLPSANTLLYYCVCFSRSLAVRLPASRLGVDKDGSCPSVSDRLDPSIFLILCKDITLFMRLFFLSLSLSDFRLVGSVFTETDRVHPCPIDSIRRLFLLPAKSLLY